MNPPPIPTTLSTAAPALALRLTIILTALATHIAHAFLRHPTRAPLILPLWRYLTRSARRFAALLAHIAAGRLPCTQKRTPHSGPRPINFPTAHGWLVADLRHEAAIRAGQLATLLAEPAMAEILAAAPQAARLLRPLCRMLGLPTIARPRAAPTPPPSPPAEPIRQAPPQPVTRHHPEPPCPRARWPWFSPTAKPA